MTTVALLSLFLSLGPSGTLPDLCAEPMQGSDGADIEDSTGLHLSRHCEWTVQEVPFWDDDLCCEVQESSAATCVPALRRGACQTGERYYCEHGEVLSTGEVVCYQPLPDACAAGHCIEAPSTTPPTVALIPFILCCNSGGACVWAGYEAGACEGEILYCSWGMSNADGTVECYEYE